MQNRNPTHFITPNDFAVQQKINQLSGRFQNVIAYISNVPYAYDNPMYDYWQLPSQTIIRGMGDCEDQSFLLASLCICIGINARVLLGRVTEGHGVYGHAWVEIKTNGQWRTLEPTSPNPIHITWTPVQIFGWANDITFCPYTPQIWNKQVIPMFGQKNAKNGTGLQNYDYMTDTGEFKKIDFSEINVPTADDKEFVKKFMEKFLTP